MLALYKMKLRHWQTHARERPRWTTMIIATVRGDPSAI